MALNMTTKKKNDQEEAAYTEDAPIVSDGVVSEGPFLQEEDENPTASYNSVPCSGLIHNSLFTAVPLSWVTKNDEHNLFHLTMEEKYKDGRAFLGAITIRGSFVSRKETQMLL